MYLSLKCYRIMAIKSVWWIICLIDKWKGISEANSLFSFVLILFLDCFDFGFGNIAKSHEMRCDMDFISYFMSRQHLMVDIYGKLWPRIIDFTPKWLFQEINLTCCLIHSYFKCVCEWSSISRLKIEHATSLSRSIIFEKKKRVHAFTQLFIHFKWILIQATTELSVFVLSTFLDAAL